MNTLTLTIHHRIACCDAYAKTYRIVDLPSPRDAALRADPSLAFTGLRTTGTSPTLHDDDESLARMIEANHDYMSVAYLHNSITER